MDTGIKEYEDVENIYETLKEEGIEDDLDDTYARKRIISQKEESYLPLSLQYEILEENVFN